jgi:phytoene synthase
MQQLYRDISYKTSKLITRSYSTSFSIAVSYLPPETGDAIYSIYGFVRLADEIVDSFHGYDRKSLIEQLEHDYYLALADGISINPVLNSFQETVRKYNIPGDLIEAFISSMKTDLVKSEYNSGQETSEYIYGSAEVVGLMCLMVFVKGNLQLYNELKEPARKLGAAFQKVNFLRDIRNDTEKLDRYYFHHMNGRIFNEMIKKKIVDEIRNDFRASVDGIRKLPDDCRPGVQVAYYYFLELLDKIERTPAGKQFEKRIRVSDIFKIFLLGKALVFSKLKMI